MSSKGPNPRAGASSGSEACTSTRTSPEEKAGPEVSIGNCAPNSSSTSSAQTSSKPTLPTRSSMSTPRYRSDPPSRSGSAIAVWNATTPSNPGTKSAPFAGVVVISDDLHIEDGNCGWELRGGDWGSGIAGGELQGCNEIRHRAVAFDGVGRMRWRSIAGDELLGHELLLHVLPTRDLGSSFTMPRDRPGSQSQEGVVGHSTGIRRSP